MLFGLGIKGTDNSYSGLFLHYEIPVFFYVFAIESTRLKAHGSRLKAKL
jgi:hypothetical protein